jgi:MFS family permease
MTVRYARDPQTHQSLRHSVRDGVAYSTMAGAGESYFTAYALLLKASSLQVSVLTALPALFGSIAQVLSAWLTQRLARRRRVVLIGVGIQAVAWLPILWLPWLFPAIAVPLLIAGVALYVAGGHLATPAWNSWIGDLVPSQRRGRFFAMRTRLMSITLFLSLGGAGALLHLFEAGGHERLGFTLIFAIATLARLYSWWQLRAMHEPAYAPPSVVLPGRHELLARLPESNFARFALYSAAMSFAVSISAPFFAVLMLRDLQFTYLEYTLNTGAMVIAQFLSLRLWGRIADVYGNRLVILVTGAVIPAFPVLWLLSPNFYYLTFLQATGGIAWAGFTLATGNMLFDVVPPERRATYSAVHQVLTLLAIFAGALAGGALVAAAPSALTVFGVALTFTSSLWAALTVSTAVRLVIAVTLLPRIREVRPVRPMSAGGLVGRVVGLNALTGMLTVLLPRRRGKDAPR